MIAILRDDQSDILSDLLERAAGMRSLKIRTWTHREAAQSIGVVVRKGVARVSPDCSLLLRPNHSMQPASNDADARFLDREHEAHLTSILALCTRAVVNRPQATCHRAWLSIAMPELGAIAESNSVEWVTAGVLTPSTPGQVTGVYDFEQAETEFLQPPGVEASRIVRWIPLVGRSWEVVVVVGYRGWFLTRAAPPHLDLVRRSIAAAQSLGLAFASFYWAIDQTQRRAQLTKVNAFPASAECATNLPEIVAALIEMLES